MHKMKRQYLKKKDQEKEAIEISIRVRDDGRFT